MTLHLNRLTIDVEQYYKMAEVGIIRPTDRVELIEGEVLTMSPINSPHASIVNALNEESVLQLAKKATIIVQNPIRINSKTEPEPDLIIAKYRKDKYAKAHPKSSDALLVIEVADSSLQFDKTIKLPIYAKAGIPEYWIVNVEKKQIIQ